MGDEKYSPDYVKMDLADAKRAAKAAKNMADRRFKRFKSDMQEVIDGRRYDKDDYKTVAVGPTNQPTNQKNSVKSLALIACDL
jgi:hypothetical protein